MYTERERGGKLSCSFAAEKSVKGKKGNERQTELRFPLQVVTHKHEGGMDYSGMWLPWRHNKQKGGRYSQAGFHSDVPVIVCMDKNK